MSKYNDMLFWVVMTLIILAIGFLSYVTFFSPSTQLKTTAPPKRLKAQKVQTLYVCDDEAKIRALPRQSGKIIQTAKKGEQVMTIKAKKDWFGVKTNGGKMGWIEKKSLCDHPPKAKQATKPKKQPQQPAAPPQKAEKKKSLETPSANQSAQGYTPPPQPTAGSVENLINGLFNRINSRTQRQFGQPLFNDYNMLDSGMRLEVKATDTWSLLPKNFKLQVLQVLSRQYAIIACNAAKIVNCTEDTPSISIIDSSGREIAYQNSSGSQVLD